MKLLGNVVRWSRESLYVRDKVGVQRVLYIRDMHEKIVTIYDRGDEESRMAAICRIYEDIIGKEDIVVKDRKRMSMHFPLPDRGYPSWMPFWGASIATHRVIPRVRRSAKPAARPS